MSNRNFQRLLAAKWAEGKFLCIGLDPIHDKLPDFLKTGNISKELFEFNRDIIDATFDLVCAYKPNTAFYEAFGDAGILALQRTVDHINTVAPNVPVIIDAKRGDIGNTNQRYCEFVFDHLKGDAVTIHPYLGREAVQPFLDYSEKGIFVLCRTSNPGAGEFQDLRILKTETVPLYLQVADNVSRSWNENKNCGLVVGATYPQEIGSIRAVAPEVPFLIPGIGTQGGDVEAAVKNGRNSDGTGFIINSSSGIIFASSGPDFAEAARKKAYGLNHEIRAVN